MAQLGEYILDLVDGAGDYILGLVGCAFVFPCWEGDAMTEPLTRKQFLETVKMASSFKEWENAAKLLYHHDAALRAQLEKYQRDKQIGDVLMLEGSQKIDELRAQLAQAMQSQEQLAANVNMGLLEIRTLKAELAQVTAELDDYDKACSTEWEVSALEDGGNLIDKLRGYRARNAKLQHRLAEAERQRDAHANVASERRRELYEAQARIKELTSQWLPSASDQEESGA